MFRHPLLPGIIWTLIIVVLTLIPGNYIPRVGTFFDWLGPDKLVHLILFGIYAYLLLAGFSRHNNNVLHNNAVAISFAVGMVFAIFTELSQKFLITGRNGNQYDFMADMLGWIMGYLSWRLIRRNEKKKLSTSKKYN